jgi:UDP-N-acetyl-D-mannosaminuronate dehydrogenase
MDYDALGGADVVIVCGPTPFSETRHTDVFQISGDGCAPGF